MDKLTALRQEIDALDEQIQHLLVQRFQVTDEVGRLKQQQQTPILDQTREQAIYAQLEARYSVADAKSLAHIYQTVMAESRARQNNFVDKL